MAALEIKFSVTPVFACFSKLDFRPSTLLLNVILLPTPKRFLKSLWLTNTFWSWWSRVSFIWIFLSPKNINLFFEYTFWSILVKFFYFPKTTSWLLVLYKAYKKGVRSKVVVSAPCCYDRPIHTTTLSNYILSKYSILLRFYIEKIHSNHRGSL